MIREGDIDGDGHINFEEFRLMMDRWRTVTLALIIMHIINKWVFIVYLFMQVGWKRLSFPIWTQCSRYHAWRECSISGTWRRLSSQYRNYWPCFERQSFLFYFFVVLTAISPSYAGTESYPPRKEKPIRIPLLPKALQQAHRYPTSLSSTLVPSFSTILYRPKSKAAQVMLRRI